MTTRLFPPFFQFEDADGVPLSGGTLEFYSAGTSTPKDTYADAGLTVSNGTITLNALGRSPVAIFAEVGDYRIVLKDADGVVIGDEDPVPGEPAPASDEIWTGNQQVFTTSGTWTVPAGITKVRARVWGVGGSGGGSSSLDYPGGGGGAGGYGEGVYTVTPGASITITVGVGTAGADGGASSFGTFLTANGGTKGGEGTGSAVGTGGAGGTVVGADLSIPGSAGESGIRFQNSTTREGGTGAASYGSSTTRAVGDSGTGFNGGAGRFPGGGASGCTNSTAAGGDGLVLVEW